MLTVCTRADKGLSALVCTERTIRHLLVTVCNSAAVLDMTGLNNPP